MIAVKAESDDASRSTLNDGNVLLVLRDFGPRRGNIFVLTMFNQVAKKIAQAYPHWPSSSGGNYAFRTGLTDLDCVAVMLTRTLPEIEHWETQ